MPILLQKKHRKKLVLQGKIILLSMSFCVLCLALAHGGERYNSELVETDCTIHDERMDDELRLCVKLNGQAGDGCKWLIFDSSSYEKSKTEGIIQCKRDREWIVAEEINTGIYYFLFTISLGVSLVVFNQFLYTLFCALDR